MIGLIIKFAVGVFVGWTAKHYYTKWKIKKLLGFLNDPVDETVNTFIDLFKKLGIKFKEEK